MNRNVFFCRILSGVLAVAFIFSSGVSAANDVIPNWNLGNIEVQTRHLTTSYNGSSAVIGGGSVSGNSNNNVLVIDSPITVSAPASAYVAGTAYVAGGVVYDATANNNKVEISNGATIQGRDVIGGAAFLQYVDYRRSSGTASGNTVTIDHSSVKESSYGAGGNVIGGYTDYAHGHAENNTVNINASTVDGHVYGGVSGAIGHLIVGPDVDPDTGDILYPVDTKILSNTVKVTGGSHIGGDVVGSYLGDTATWNTVEIDNSTVDGVVAGAVQGISYYGEEGGKSIFAHNLVDIKNGSEVGGAVGITGSSALATDNTLQIDNSVTKGKEVITVLNHLDLHGENDPINANIQRNELKLSHMNSAVNAFEAGASLNFAGTASTNTVTFENVSNFKVTGRDGTAFDGKVNISDVIDNKLFAVKSLAFDKKTAEKYPYESYLYKTADLNTDYGFIYGGAAFDYTSQVGNLTPKFKDGELAEESTQAPEKRIIGNGGTNSDYNNVYFKDSKVTGNIVGGLSAELIEVNYATWAKGEDGLTKTQVTKVGNITITQNYKCDALGQNCVADGEPTMAAESSMDGKIFSASTNTVTFENTTIGENSVVYGGFVAGADLRVDNAVTEHNTVILKGNTKLEDGVMIYGGNTEFGQPTNKLIFDHNWDENNPNTYVTFNKEQFANFNEVWDVYVDPNTRLKIEGDPGVKLLVTPDPSSDYGDGVRVIIVNTQANLTDVDQQNHLQETGRFDLTDTTVELAYNKRGAYSYYLVDWMVSNHQVGEEIHKDADDENIKTFGQVPLAGIALASEGTEMLNQTFKEAWKSESDFNVFVNGGYHDTRYTTGSGFDMRSEIAQVGIWKKFQSNWMGGLFAKYGHGTYETFPINAEGNVDAYGVGLMTSYYYSETGRIEGNIEVGKIDMTFNSSGKDSVNANLKTDGMYFGFLAGIVQDMSEDWELFANLQFLRKAEDNTTDSEDEGVKYDGLQTATLRFGTNYIFSDVSWDGLVPSVGIMGLYEMLGKSDVLVAGNDGNKDASLGGFSARAQARLTYHNESFFPIISELTAYGQVGKRRGWGGEANISFLF